MISSFARGVICGDVRWDLIVLGAVICSVIIVLVCLIPGLGSPVTALVAAIYYLIYMQVEAYFLSPRIMRKFRLLQITDDSDEPMLRVAAIHDDLGYRKVRSALSRQYDLARREPDIQVADVDLAGDRHLVLSHAVYDGVLLEEKTARQVLRHASMLWGYPVQLLEIDAATDEVLRTHEVNPPDED